MLITLEILITRILDEDWSWRAGTVWQTALKAQGAGKKPNSGQSGGMKGKCWNCGKKGHYKKDCWAKGGGKEGQAPAWFKPKNADTAKQSEETEFAFVTNNDIALAVISASDWLADSAATTPIARNRTAFTSYLEEPSMIEGITPGAVLQTHGWGMFLVEFKVKNKIYLTTLWDVKHAPNNLISIG